MKSTVIHATEARKLMPYNESILNAEIEKINKVIRTAALDSRISAMIPIQRSIVPYKDELIKHLHEQGYVVSQSSKYIYIRW